MTKRIVKNQHEPPISPPLQQQYQSYYGITLIETLMSVGLLGLVLIPMLMTSSAYLSTKIMGTRSTTDLATNVNALASKLNTLAARAATVNPAVSDATTLSLSVQLANGVRRSFEYSLTGAPGSRRLREVQGNATTRSAHSALRSSDTIALTSNAAFGYCAQSTCTSTTNTAAKNYGIMKAADVVFLDGDVTTAVGRTPAGFSNLETVQFAQIAGTDGSGKSMNLPVNVFALGTDPYVAENGGQPNPDSGSPSTTGLVTTLGTGDGTPNAAYDPVVNNPRPFGVITAKSKTAVFGMDDADINVFSGSGTFSAVPMATQLPPAPSRGISQVPHSRIYKEGAGDGTEGNVKSILSNFQLDQTVADSFQGNMCFTGNRGLDGAFQVYYWNRTLPTALLTSVQSVQNATDPFNMTPECAGASAGYSAYNPNQGNYYVQTYPRLQYQTPTTWVDQNTPLGFVENWNGWVEPIRQIWQNTEAHYQWYAWDKDNGYTSPSGRTYFYTDGKVGWKKCGWWGTCIAGIWRFWEPTGYGNITKPKFATPMPAGDQVWDEFQEQPKPQVGFHTLVHQHGNYPDISVPVNVLDPFGGNHQQQLYQRGRRTFNIYGTEGSNPQGDRQSCDFTPVQRPYNNTRYLVCSDMHRPENIQYFNPTGGNREKYSCKVTYNSHPNDPPTWTKVPLQQLTGTKVFGKVTGNTFTVGYYETNIDGQTDYFFDNKDFVLDGLACKYCWAEIPSSLTNSTTLVGSQRPVTSYTTYETDSDGNYVYDLNGNLIPIEVKYVSFYNNLNNIGGASDTYQDFQLIKDDGLGAQPDSYVFYLGGQDGWRYQSNGYQAYISECNIWQQAQWAQVPNIKPYINDNPAVINGVQSDTINSSGTTPPYIIRRDNTDDMFYHLVNSNGSRVYAFSPAINRIIAGPPVNTDWSAVAQTRMAQGKRVLSYSPVNRLAITGNTSGYGDVYAWYYDNADQPVPTVKQGGLGFNAGQVNGPRVNYIGKTNMEATYQHNLTAIASEGNNIYTLDRTTGMITRYGAETGSRNYVRQSEATYADAKISARGTLAVSPLDDGMYILDADTKRVNYYSNRRGGATLVQQGNNGPYAVVGQSNNSLQPEGSRSFNATQAALPTGLAISKVTGNVYVLDSDIGTVTQGSGTTRTLNIQVYNANGGFLRTFALDVSNNMFRDANDRLVPENGQIMRLSLDEARSQFYVSVGSNGKIYQFGVDQTI